MFNKVLLRRSKINQSFTKEDYKKDLVSFVTTQFKSLIKKNLQVPIKLYQL